MSRPRGLIERWTPHEETRAPLDRPRRHGVRTGLDDAISLVIPDPAPDDPCTGGGYVGRGVEHYLASIGGADGFRKAMIAAIASYYATNGAAAAPGPIKTKVREAIGNADPGGRSAADIARYCSDKHLDDIIAWVRAHERSKPLSAYPSPAELATAIPIGNERPRALYALLRHLLRQRYLDPHPAVALAGCFNDVHCSPPLPGDQVTAIARAVAACELKKAEGRHG